MRAKRVWCGVDLRRVSTIFLLCLKTPLNPSLSAREEVNSTCTPVQHMLAAASWLTRSSSCISSNSAERLFAHRARRQGLPLLHQLFSTAAFHWLSYASTGNPSDVIAYDEVLAGGSSDERKEFNIMEINPPPSSHLVSGLLERASMYEEKYGPLCKVWIGPNNPNPGVYYNDAGAGVKRMYESTTDTGEHYARETPRMTTDPNIQLTKHARDTKRH